MNFSSQLLKRNVLTLCVFLFVFGFASQAQQYSEQAFSGMKWRQIGPFRGGRVLAVTGVPGDPATFYFGAVAGGVWKAKEAGRPREHGARKKGNTAAGALA